MEILLKSFFYFFIMVTLAGFVSVRAQTTESTLMTTMVDDMEDGEPMTTEKDEKPDMTTSQKMPEDKSTVTNNSGEEGKTTDADGEGTEKMSTEKMGTEKMSTEKVGTGTEIYTGSFTTRQMSTKGETPDGSTPKQCYTCESEGKDGDNECAAKQMDDSKTTDCDGNCWITVFYGESDKFFNISRTCGQEECSSMNQEDFECKNIEKNNDTKEMCTYCCSTDRCNGMSDAPYLRYNGIILIGTIIANGLLHC